MAITALQSQTKLLERLQDLSDVPDATFLSWCDYLNKWAYRRLTQIDPERFVSTQSYTISSNPQTSALPASFRDVQAMGCGFYVMDSTGTFIDDELIRTGFGSRSKGYWISGTNVVFTGMETGTITLRYIPTVSTIDDLADTFSIPDEYMQYIEEALVKLYMVWDEDPNKEALADQRFMNYLDDLFSSVRKEPAVYELPSQL